MKKLIGTALVAAVIFGTAHASNIRVYQFQYKNDDGDWIEEKYYMHQIQCADDVVRAANEKGWKLDRFRCVEAEIN